MAGPQSPHPQANLEAARVQNRDGFGNPVSSPSDRRYDAGIKTVPLTAPDEAQPVSAKSAPHGIGPGTDHPVLGGDAYGKMMYDLESSAGKHRDIHLGKESK